MVDHPRREVHAGYVEIETGEGRGDVSRPAAPIQHRPGRGCGAGCADCVVTVLLGAPPGWQSADPVVVPLSGRVPTPGGGRVAEDVVVPRPGVVVDFDDVERRAVGVLAQSGLVPPLRHETEGP